MKGRDTEWTKLNIQEHIKQNMDSFMDNEIKTSPGAVQKPVSANQTNEIIIKIYAALGELSVRRKQAVQTLDKIDERIELLEQQLVKVIETSKETANEPEATDQA